MTRMVELYTIYFSLLHNIFLLYFRAKTHFQHVVFMLDPVSSAYARAQWVNLALHYDI